MKALPRGSLSAEFFLAAFLGLCCNATPSFSASYDEQRLSAVKTCQSIDPAEYQSGLMFNPDGYRSYYVRSECFQRTAFRFRDETLCREVKQRRSLFSSSWGYSSGRCRELVAEGVAADRKSLEEIKQKYLAALCYCVIFVWSAMATGVISISFRRSAAITPTVILYALKLSRRIPAKKLCSTPPAIMWTAKAICEFFSGTMKYASASPILRPIARTWSARLSFWTLAMAGWLGCGAMDSSTASFPRAREANRWNEKYDSELILSIRPDENEF